MSNRWFLEGLIVGALLVVCQYWLHPQIPTTIKTSSSSFVL